MDQAQLGHDPFAEDDLDTDLADLGRQARPVDKRALNPEGMRKIQEEGGFDRPVFKKPEERKREPLKSIQFRLPESEIDAFHAAAYEEFGNKHGAKTDLFRKMWALYQESRNS